MSEPKVTECYTGNNADGAPSTELIGKGYFHSAILLWREDYDAMRKELEELRARVSYESESHERQIEYLKTREED